MCIYHANKDMLFDEDEIEYSLDLFIPYKDVNSLTVKLLNSYFYNKNVMESTGKQFRNDTKSILIYTKE